MKLMSLLSWFIGIKIILFTAIKGAALLQTKQQEEENQRFVNMGPKNDYHIINKKICIYCLIASL